VPQESITRSVQTLLAHHGVAGDRADLAVDIARWLETLVVSNGTRGARKRWELAKSALAMLQSSVSGTSCTRARVLRAIEDVTADKTLRPYTRQLLEQLHPRFAKLTDEEIAKAWRTKGGAPAIAARLACAVGAFGDRPAEGKAGAQKYNKSRRAFVEAGLEWK